MSRVWQGGEHAGDERLVTPQTSNPRPVPCWRRLYHLTPRVPAMSRVAGGRRCRGWTPRDATGLEPAPCPTGARSFI
eukprot:scaffold31588_cov64-Phaeocystis_antarctica.AAC.5